MQRMGYTFTKAISRHKATKGFSFNTSCDLQRTEGSCGHSGGMYYMVMLCCIQVSSVIYVKVYNYNRTTNRRPLYRLV